MVGVRQVPAMHPTPFSPDPAATVRLPSREEVRAVVAQQQRAMLAAAQRGENPHHVALDNTDKLHQFAAALGAVHGPVSASTFLAMWTEEVEASSAALAAETDRITGEQASAGHTAEMIGGALALLAVLAVLWMIVN